MIQSLYCAHAIEARLSNVSNEIYTVLSKCVRLSSDWIEYIYIYIYIPVRNVAR